jgi:Raf kinase inhibitor-like YbhB/YbcL family protein
MRERSLLLASIASGLFLLDIVAWAGSSSSLTITSDAFEDGKPIPREYTCDGADRSPPLHWRGVPEGVATLALVVDDPDAPSGNWNHWLIYNMPSGTLALGEAVPATRALGDGSRQGTNGFGKIGYGGPCPPRGSTHRYQFKLYALSKRIELEPGARRDAVLQAIRDGKIVAEAQLTGTYARPAP